MSDFLIDLELRLPPLTDSLQRLLSLNPEERNNPRLLELLAHRDTMAATRLMMLANSAALLRGRPSRTVGEAILRLGSATTYDALLGTWVLDGVAGEGSLDSRELRFRNRMAQLLTELCITARRICEALDDAAIVLSEVQSDVVLVVAVQLLALTLSADAPERLALEGTCGRGVLLISEPPNLGYLQDHLVALATYWRAPPLHIEQLRHWSRHRRPNTGIAIGILAERMAFFLRHKPECTLDMFLSDLSAYPLAAELARRVVSRGVSLRSLSVTF